MKRWRQYEGLSKAERRALHRGFLTVPVIFAAIRVFGFYRLQRILERLAPSQVSQPRHPAEREIEQGRLTARMVDAASRNIWPQARCLERSLTAWWLLRWQRLPASLRIGVRRETEGLQAHAWLEMGGVVLNDSAEIYRGYTAFARAIESAGHSSS